MTSTRAVLPQHDGVSAARGVRLLGVCVALLWWLCFKSYANRWYALLHYNCTAVVSPLLEPLAPLPAITFWLSLVGLVLCIVANESLWRKFQVHGTVTIRYWLIVTACMAIAIAPWIVDVLLHLSPRGALAHQSELQDSGVWAPSIWKPLWFSALTGLAAQQYWLALGKLPDDSQTSTGKLRGKARATALPMRDETMFVLGSRGWNTLINVSALLCGVWWVMQSQQAYQRFMLGFNDCGHFAQRIANTAGGRGWLLETPVLPAFWDHFNPGLILLVPLWWLWPSMSLIFVVHSAALAMCSPLIYQLARRLGATPATAGLWGLAWLMQPVLGQMNLAYTYGWHPITLAIPCLLAALLCMLRQRWAWAIGWAVLACSFEEGVFIIIATTMATLAIIEFLAARSASLRDQTLSSSKRAPKVDWVTHPARRVSRVLSTHTHIAVAVVSSLAFMAVFRFSGLAEFQTGRFPTLGSSALEILSSPITRPADFWGLLLRERNAFFLAALFIPCFLPALLRGWPLLLPTLLPLGVLMVWDHLPAQSIAFHYASTLLPAVWLASIVGSVPGESPNDTASSQVFSPMAYAALVTSIVAGFFFGQMPWSADNLHDVVAQTFSTGSELRRALGSEDNHFAHRQLAAIRSRAGSVLATGRFATHLVGVDELETVGQFHERRPALATLTPGRHPLQRYETLIFDRLETFQQRAEQTAQLEEEAKASGFEVVADSFDIVVLQRR